MTDYTDYIGEDVHVFYGNDSIPYQVDGTIIGVTPDALEGQFLVMVEMENQDAEVEEGLRSIPLDLVVGVSLNER